jgi:hypothetical protein
MKNTAYIIAALSLFAASAFVSCQKEKTEPTSPVIYENAVAVEGITLDKTLITFTEKKQEFVLTATITPENASEKRILWKSSNEKVAKVSNGVVESVDYGTCVITATTYAGNFTTSCAVQFLKDEVDSRAVDLLGSNGTIYWSSVNFGAEAPEDLGTFVAWGETAGKTSYTWDSYIVNLLGWCDTEVDPIVDDDDISNTEFDVVAAKWGDGWRMPTASEVAYIVKNMSWTWTSTEGVYGYTVENPNSGKSIFLPVTGYYDAAILAHSGAKARYWTADKGDEAYNAWSLDFDSNGYSLDQHTRYLGFVIRPVLDKE